MWCVSKQWGLGGRCVSDTELQPFAFPFVTRVSGYTRQVSLYK